jgi:DNA-binding response OmpR family regulator
MATKPFLPTLEKARERERLPMSRLSYETAETLIYDPIAANRTATRSLLYHLGFRRIDTVANIETLDEMMKRRPPDLALCEAQGVESALFKMIQNLRQGTSGYNPFVVVMITAWEKSASLVNGVLNSGADDLLLRPFSTALLGQRIVGHIERRKGFVITSDYVGPDRRSDSNRPSNVELFNPPNSLKMKARDGLSTEDTNQRLEASLKTARETLTTEKLRRDAFQVCILWRLVQDYVPGISKFENDLAKLKDITRSIARRCAHTDMEFALEWCDGVLGAVEGLELGVDRNASMHLLGYAALSLNQALAPEKSSTDHLEAIDTTVAMIKARDQPAIAS